MIEHEFIAPQFIDIPALFNVENYRDCTEDVDNEILFAFEYYLKLNPKSFWNTIIYDVHFWKYIDDFLVSAPRKINTLSPLSLKLIQYIFLIFLRCCSYKEIKEAIFVENGITKDFMEKDICKLYQKLIKHFSIITADRLYYYTTFFYNNNPIIIEKMLQFLFSKFPSLHEEFDKFLVDKLMPKLGILFETLDMMPFTNLFNEVFALETLLKFHPSFCNILAEKYLEKFIILYSKISIDIKTTEDCRIIKILKNIIIQILKKCLKYKFKVTKESIELGKYIEYLSKDILPLIKQANMTDKEINEIFDYYSNVYLEWQSKEISKKDIVEDMPSTSQLFNKNLSSPSCDIDKDASQILDLFPHMSVSDVKGYLKYFENKTDMVINAIMEDNLPPFDLLNSMNNDSNPSFELPKCNLIANKPKKYDKFVRDKKLDILEGNQITKIYMENKAAEKLFQPQIDNDSDSSSYDIPTNNNKDYDDEYDDTIYNTGFSSKQTPLNLQDDNEFNEGENSKSINMERKSPNNNDAISNLKKDDDKKIIPPKYISHSNAQKQGKYSNNHNRKYLNDKKNSKFN